MNTNQCIAPRHDSQTLLSQPDASHLRDHLKVLLGRIWIHNLSTETAARETRSPHEQLLLAIIRIQPTTTREQLAQYLALSHPVLTHLILSQLGVYSSPTPEPLDPDHALQALIADCAETPAPHTWEAWIWEFLESASLATLGELHRTFLKTLGRLQPSLSVPNMCITCTHFSAFHYPLDPIRPHHCQLLNARVLDVDLRVDCPEHRLRSSL